jgi:hypothetical protein
LVAMAVAALVVPLALAQAPAAAAEESGGVEASLDLSVLSSYVWRGQVLNDEGVLQPSLTVSEWGFTFNYWGNMNLTDEITGDAHEFSEHDLSVEYGAKCPVTGADVAIGIVNYDFPNQAVAGESFDALVRNTHEVYAKAAFNEVLLAPALAVYYDINEADGFYGSLGVSHSFELCSAASADIAFSAGMADSDYNLYYWGVDDSALNDGNVSLSLPWTINDTWTITPIITYTWLWDSDIEDAAEQVYLDKDQVYGGVTASLTF